MLMYWLYADKVEVNHNKVTKYFYKSLIMLNLTLLGQKVEIDSAFIVFFYDFLCIVIQ